jgi:hypothetical protein
MFLHHYTQFLMLIIIQKYINIEKSRILWANGQKIKKSPKFFENFLWLMRMEWGETKSNGRLISIF